MANRPTQNKTEETALAVYKGISNLLITLYARWQDEREYEDFAEYSKRLEQELEAKFPAVKFVRASKRPFAMTYEVDGTKFQIQCNSKSLNLFQIQ